MTDKKRIEFDSLGQKKINKNSLWGAQTQRSIENFKIGNEKIPKELIVALGLQKKAAAQANMELGTLSKKIGKQIVNACNEIINLNLINEFPLVVWHQFRHRLFDAIVNTFCSLAALQKSIPNLSSSDICPLGREEKEL